MSLGGKDGGEEKEERRMKGALQRVKGAEETKITKYKCISHPFSTYVCTFSFPRFCSSFPLPPFPSFPLSPSPSSFQPIEELEAEMLHGQKLQGPLTAKEVHDVLVNDGKVDE